MWLFAVGMAMAVGGSVAGNFFVKQGAGEIQGRGLKEFGGIRKLLNPVQLYQFLAQLGIFNNWRLWLGIAFLTLFFGGYLLAMQQAPVTLVVPLMASTYIINTGIGKFVLHEHVSLLRWLGVAVIVAGIILLVGFSESEAQQNQNSDVTYSPIAVIGLYQRF
jgi:drug/metabolite transporter (DMT)-like permease